jgi:hypothetical protein
MRVNDRTETRGHDQMTGPFLGWVVCKRAGATGVEAAFVASGIEIRLPGASAGPGVFA